MIALCLSIAIAVRVKMETLTLRTEKSINEKARKVKIR
jgi:hypothetical protein